MVVKSPNVPKFCSLWGQIGVLLFTEMKWCSLGSRCDYTCGNGWDRVIADLNANLLEKPLKNAFGVDLGVLEFAQTGPKIPVLRLGESR